MLLPVLLVLSVLFVLPRSECPSVDDAVENAGSEGGVPYDLKHGLEYQTEVRAQRMHDPAQGRVLTFTAGETMVQKVGAGPEG